MMPVDAAPSSIYAPALLVAVGVALMPIAGRMPRGILAALFVATWGAASAALVELMGALLAVGRWDLVLEDGYTGAVLARTSPLRVSVDALRFLVVSALHVGGGLALVGARQAFGGGARRLQTPATAGQRVTMLVLLGLVELAVLVDDLTHVATLAALGAGVSGLLLFAAKSTTAGIHGVAWLFALHRVGDVALFVAIAVLAASGLPVVERDLLVAVAELDPVHLVDHGPLVGFAWRVALDTAVGLLAVFLATRLFVFPFSSAISSCTEAPMPVLVFAHGLGGVGIALVVALRCAALLHAAPTVAALFALLLVVSALHQLVAALSLADLVEIDARMLFALSCLVLVALIVGAMSSVVLGFALCFVAATAALLADGAAIEALQGTADIFRMGGLWRHLRKTDAVRALATFSMVGLPGLTGFVFYDGLLFASLASSRGGFVLFALSALAVLLVGVVALRSLHVVFVGDAPRAAAPANLVEPSRERWLSQLVVVLTVSGLGLLFALPGDFLALAFPGAFAALEVFVAPATLPHLVALYRAGGALPFDLEAAPRLLSLGVVTALFVVAYATSFVLYRRRPLAPGLSRSSPLLIRARSLVARDFDAMRTIARFVQNPVLDVARAISRVARPVLVDGLLEQAPKGAAALLAVSARLLHAGDVQRAILVVIVVIVVALTLWGRP